MEVRYSTPPQNLGYFVTPYETRRTRAIPPSAILSRKGLARYGGGISHWAAKRLGPQNRPRANNVLGIVFETAFGWSVDRSRVNRELRGWQRRGCLDRCQEGPERGTQTVN